MMVKTPTFLLTHVILDAVTCGSSRLCLRQKSGIDAVRCLQAARRSRLTTLNPFELASPTTSEEGGATASLPDSDSDDIGSPTSEGADARPPPPCFPVHRTLPSAQSTEKDEPLIPADVLCDSEDARATLPHFCSSCTAPFSRASRVVLGLTRLACAGASGGSGSGSNGFAAEFGAEVGGSDSDEDAGRLGGKRRGGRGEFASADDWAARIQTAEVAAAEGAPADKGRAHRPGVRRAAPSTASTGFSLGDGWVPLARICRSMFSCSSGFECLDETAS